MRRGRAAGPHGGPVRDESAHHDGLVDGCDLLAERARVDVVQFANGLHRPIGLRA
jgi:hypothetical protein